MIQARLREAGRFFAVLGFLWAHGCLDSDIAGSGDAGGGSAGGVASSQAVEQCKDACNQLKFFDCNDAAEHSACFTSCEGADDAEIERFVACVQADICDPACVENLHEAAPPPEPPEPASCEAACQEVIAGGCFPGGVDCGGFCGSLTADERAFVVYCEGRRDGCSFPDECTTTIEEDDAAGACLEACETLAYFECIDASAAAQCRDRCTDATEASEASEAFVACVAEGVCEDDGCWETFAGGQPGGDVDLCRFACDDMNLFQCIDSQQHATCRELCGSAESQRVETFLGCLGYAGGGTVGGPPCEDSSCYDVFASG